MNKYAVIFISYLLPLPALANPILYGSTRATETNTSPNNINQNHQIISQPYQVGSSNLQQSFNNFNPPALNIDPRSIFLKPTTQPTQCPRTNVIFNFSYVPAPVDDTQSYRYLTQNTSTHRNNTSDFTLGLYTSNFTVNLSPTYALSKSQSGLLGCMSKINVNVDLKHKILIAQEINQAKAPCSYNNALSHERQHEKHKLYAIELAKARLDELFTLYRFEYYSLNPNDSTDQLQRVPQLLAQSLIDLMGQSSSYFDQLIDQPQEYKRLSYQCNQESGKILGAEEYRRRFN